VIAFAQKFSRMDDFLTQDDEGVEGADDDRDQGAEYVSKEFRLVNLINKVPPKKKSTRFSSRRLAERIRSIHGMHIKSDIIQRWCNSPVFISEQTR